VQVIQKKQAQLKKTEKRLNETDNQFNELNQKINYFNALFFEMEYLNNTLRSII